MDNKKVVKPFAIWGDITEEKVKKAVEKRTVTAKEEEEKKDKLLQVRVSADYYEKLKNTAKEREINVSLLVRDAVMQYIPTTLTQEEKETVIKDAKNRVMAGMIWTLTNTIPAIRENYNYEMSFVLPDEETLISMYDDNAFKSVKIQALNQIISEITLNKKIDSETDELIKKLITAYMSK